MTYIYSLYDPETNKLLHRGTPVELVKKGLYKTRGAVNAAYRVQTDGAKPRRWRIEREVEGGNHDKPHRGSTGEARHDLTKKAPRAKLGDKSKLAQDVHWLCRYNAKARKRGHRELSYGQWAALGKPEEPV